jgi:hypothetical protein
VLHPFSRQHDFELEGFSYRIVACEDEVEDICTELAPLKQEDAHATNEPRRAALADLTTHAEGTQAGLRVAV